MLWTIILLPIIICLGLMYWGSQLPEDSMLRLAFQLFFLPSSWLSIHFAVIAVADQYPTMTAMVTLLGDLTYYLGWILFIVGLYLLYKLLIGLVDWILQRKAKKEESRYG